MPIRFRVGLIYTSHEVVEVDADDREEAAELAAQQLNLDITDDYTVDFIEELA